MYNRNAAYDFGNLEEQRRKIGKVVRLPKRHYNSKGKLKTRKQFLVAVFSCFLVAMAGVSTFIVGQAKLTEVTDKSEKAEKELKQCESVGAQLSLKIASQGSNNAFDGSGSGSETTEIVKIPKESISEVH